VRKAANDWLSDGITYSTWNHIHKRSMDGTETGPIKGAGPGGSNVLSLPPMQRATLSTV